MQRDREPTVVLVDDEEMVLTSLNAFLTLETDYTIESFTSPEEALELLKKKTAEVIISDYLMPRMNGIQLLAQSRDLQPEAARVLLTGHADKQSAIDAINRVGLFHYIEKPWDNAALLLVIRNGIERATLLRNLRSKILQLDEAHANLKNAQSQLIRAFL